jgi:hypothetical protein
MGAFKKVKGKGSAPADGDRMAARSSLSRGCAESDLDDLSRIRFLGNFKRHLLSLYSGDTILIFR